MKRIIFNKKISIKEKISFIKAWGVFWYYNHPLFRWFSIPLSRWRYTIIYMITELSKVFFAIIKVLFSGKENKLLLFNRYLRRETYKEAIKTRDSHRLYWQYIASIAELTGQTQHQVRSWLER